MARYIDIEGAGIGKANREQFLVPEFADGWNAILKILDKEPTADVVEVVRCGKCKHSNEDGTICRYSVGRAVEPEHFCSYGVRKNENSN